MPNDFDKYEAYADDFLIGYELALQQKESKFKPYVKFAKAVKGRGAQVVDHVLPFEANTRSGGDVADTNLENADFLPRWAYPVVIDKALAITNTDRLSMLAGQGRDESVAREPDDRKGCRWYCLWPQSRHDGCGV